MIYFFIIPLLIFLTIYGCLIIYFFIGVKKTKTFHSTTWQCKTSSAIIIPACNEKNSIGYLLDDLSNQGLSLKEANACVYIIDDGSTDGTAELVKKYNALIPLLLIQTEHQGKKAAIEKGIHSSSAELIITLDADCRLGRYWLQTILSFYEGQRPDMIIGPVSMSTDRNYFSIFQSLEFMSLIASSCGAAGQRSPMMCNGANLAYKRSEFINRLDPLSRSVLSGDDVLFMHKLKKEYKSILFLKSIEAMVYTKPQHTLRSFFAQRIRWASKSGSYRDPLTITTAISVLALNSFLIVFMILCVWHLQFLIFLSIAFILKNSIDFLLLYDYAQFSGEKKLLKYQLLFSIVYPFYIVIAAIVGIIKKPTWRK